MGYPVYDQGVGSITPNGVALPNTLASMDVEEALKLRAINKKLEMESLLDDIFEDLGADVVSTGQEISVPNAIFMKLEAVPTGARTVTLPMLMALRGNPTIGAGTPLGNEHNQNLKYTTFNYQEYSYAVASTEWGTNYNDMSVYGVFEHIQPQISTYMKEFRGRRIREALIFSYDSVLTAATTISTGLSPRINSNWFIVNTDIGSQPHAGGNATVTPPQPAATAAEVSNAVVAAAATVADAYIDLNYLLSLEYYAKNNLRIEPISIDGRPTYVVLIPTIQAQLLKRNHAGLLGEVYMEMVRKSNDKMEWTGSFGRVGSLLLVEDQRYPTMEFDGLTLVPGYLNPGNVDERIYTASVDGDTTINADIGYLLGKAAICEWTVRELHFETESQNYGYNKGTGAFGESGISTVEYDHKTGWDGGEGSASRENTSSIVLVWATPSVKA